MTTSTPRTQRYRARVKARMSAMESALWNIRAAATLMLSEHDSEIWKAIEQKAAEGLSPPAQEQGEG